MERDRVRTDRGTINHELAIWGSASRHHHTEPVWIVTTKLKPYQDRRLGIVRDGVICWVAYAQHDGYIDWRKPRVEAGWVVETFGRDTVGQDLPKVRLTDEVISAINEEFEYQESRWNFSNAPANEPSVSNRLVTLRVYLAKAEEAFANNQGDKAALDVLRKVAALALRPLIEHGCPRRMSDAQQLAADARAMCPDLPIKQ